MASSTRKAQILITANASQASNTIKDLDRLALLLADDLNKMSQELDGLIKSGQGNSSQAKKLKKDITDTEKRIASYTAAVDKEIEKEKQLSEIMGNLADVKLKDLRSALARAKKEMGGLTGNQKEELEKYRGYIQKLQKQIDSMEGSTKKAGTSFSALFKNAAQMASVYMGFNAIKSKVSELVEGNLKYSDSLNDIRKVSGLTTEQVDQLANKLAKIDTRSSMEDLAKLAYSGAKLGMGKYGVEGMEQFVKAANQVQVAIGEDMGEDALPALSKMVETMGLIPKMGIEKAMLATGSAMFKLSSSSTSTSEAIVQFSKRLTGMSRAAGISTDQLLGLASASDALFLMPEVSSTAFGKLIVALQKNHNLIEKSLGIDKGTIGNLFSAGKTMDAIVLILEKMKEKGNMNALSDYFNSMDSEGQRVVSTLVTMSQNVDVLKEHLEMSKQAFEEGTAVSQEYEMQQQSAQGILERANNLWAKAFINPQGVNSIKSFAQAWYDLSKAILENPIYKGTFNASLQVVLFLCKQLLTVLPALITFLAFKGTVVAIGKVVTVFNELRLAIVDACKAQLTLKTALSSNVIGAIATGIVTVTSLIWSHVTASREAARAQEEHNRKMNEWKNLINDAASQTAAAQTKLKSYRDALTDSNRSESEKVQIMKKFKSEFGTYISALGIEINTVDDLKKSYNELNQEILKRNYYEMRETARAKVLEDRSTDVMNADKNLRDLITPYASKYGGTKYNYEYFSNQLQKKTADQVLDEFVKEVFGGKYNNIGLAKPGVYTLGNIDSHGAKTTAGNKDFSVFLSALRWNKNAHSRLNNANAEIDAQYAPYIGDYIAPIDNVDLGTLDKDAEDKPLERELRKQEAERISNLRDEKKEYMDEAQAIVDDVNNFYQRQITEKIKKATELGMSSAEQDLFLQPLKDRMSQALSEVRRAMGGTKNEWETFKLTMKKDMLEMADDTGYNFSQELLSRITKNNIDALHTKLAGVASELNVSINSLVAEILKKASVNEQNVVSLANKQANARRTAILAGDYTGTVNSQYYDKLLTEGFAKPGGDLSVQKTFIMDMFKRVRGDSAMFQQDFSSSEGIGNFIKYILGASGEDTLNLSTMADEDIRLLYNELIKYIIDYSEAEKKSREEKNNVNKFEWERSKASMTYSSAITSTESELAATKNLQDIGGAGVTAENDLEVQLWILRLEQAEAYYNYLEEHGADEQTRLEQAKNVAEANNNLQKSVTENFKEKIELMKKWMAPIEEYGTAVGEALADENKTVKEATGEMINSFIKLTGEYVKQKLTQYIMTKLYNGMITDEENSLTAVKTANAITNASTSVAEAGVETAAGSAAGAAKTVGELGWWGIPLIAAITAVLNGLMSFATSKLSQAFGGNKATANKKIVSNMLTYDAGNLSQFVGNDGRVYTARDVGSLPSGVSMITSPIATTVNGVPSLVAERGPELVVGRETTAAMQQNNPGLLRALFNYNKNRTPSRTLYDSGNLSSVSSSGSAVDMTGVLTQLTIAITALQQNGVKAKMDMWGHDGAYESLQRASNFMRGK